MDRWERRLGEYVKGAYSVLQPDGSVRTVDYEVDGERGYHAITRLTPPSTLQIQSRSGVSWKSGVNADNRSWWEVTASFV